MADGNVIEGSSTPAQRRALVLAGKSRGLDVDDLRRMTPAGSLRALSFAEASALLDRLNGKPGKPCPASTERSSGGGQKPSTGAGDSRRRSKPGVVKMITPEQRAAIEKLRVRLDWSPAHLDNFLKRIFGFTMGTIARRRDASRVIVTLVKVLKYMVNKAAQRLEANG